MRKFVIIAVLILWTAITFAVLLSTIIRRRRCSEIVTAEIVEYTNKVSSTSTKVYTKSYYAVMRYEYNGKEYTHTSGLGKPEAGETGVTCKLRIDPNSPEKCFEGYEMKAVLISACAFVLMALGLVLSYIAIG